MWKPFKLLPSSFLFSYAGGCRIRHNSYWYTADLLALEAASPCSNPVITDLPTICHFPLVSEWSPYLLSHPDQAFAAFIRRGLSSGFRIGFISSHNLRPPPANFQSVKRNSQIVDQYINEEVAIGRLSLFQHHALVRTNPIGLLPKRHQPGKYIGSLSTFLLQKGLV